VNKYLYIGYLGLFFLVVSCESPTEPDIVSPSIEWGSSYTVISGIFNLEVNSYDYYGINKIDYFIEDSLVFTDYEEPFTYEFDTSPYVNQHKINVKVISYDSSNNLSMLEKFLYVINDNNLDGYHDGDIDFLSDLSDINNLNISPLEIGCNVSWDFGRLTSFSIWSWWSCDEDINYIISSIPESISNLTKLERLILIDQNINELPEQFTDLNNLETLKIQGSNLVDLPSDFQNLQSLVELDLSCNNLISFPESITFLSQLEILDLSLNNIEYLPPNIVNLVNLKDLRIGFNSFSGNIPETLCSLINLESLEIPGHTTNDPNDPHSNFDGCISDNWSDFNGTIPECIGNLVNLERLDLQYNKLSGQIPESIGNLTSLEFLGMGYNNFDGGIPYSIGNLINLSGLELSDCNLSGPIPETMCGFPNMTSYIVLDNNSFSDIPECVCNWTYFIGSGIDMSICD